MQLRRQVLDQKADRGVNRCGIDLVVIVKDKDDVVRDGGDLIEEVGQDGFGRWCRRRSQHSERALADARGNGS